MAKLIPFVLTICIACSTLVGQPVAPHGKGPGKPAAPVTSEKITQPLQGPTVGAPTILTLVARESDGTIMRTDGPAEFVAAKLLELPDEIKQKIDRLKDARARFFDGVIENNIELLQKLDVAGKTGDKLDQALLGIQAFAKLAPLMADGSLRRQVRELLPMDRVARFDALLDEYWNAIVAQEKAKDVKKPAFAIVAGERLASLGREAESAFKRLEKSGVLVYHYLFDSMKLTPRQQATLKSILDDFVEETKGSPTKAQEAKVFISVMANLTVEQQAQLIRKFKKS